MARHSSEWSLLPINPHQARNRRICDELRIPPYKDPATAQSRILQVQARERRTHPEKGEEHDTAPCSRTYRIAHCTTRDSRRPTERPVDSSIHGKPIQLWRREK